MPVPILPLVGLAASLIGSIGKNKQRAKANKELEGLLGRDPSYTENPLARQRLGLAQTLLNARMPGAAAVERNIYTNQANQLGRLDRNATDAGQALAMAAGIGGQSDSAFNQLGINEAQDYQRRYGNLVGAQEGMIAEGDKVYGDQVRRFGDLMSIKGAQQENKANSWGDISNFGFALANFGAANPNLFSRNRGIVGGTVSGAGVANAPIQRTAAQNTNTMTSPANWFGQNSALSPQIRQPSLQSYRPLTPFQRSPYQFPQYNQTYYPQ